MKNISTIYEYFSILIKNHSSVADTVHEDQLVQAPGYFAVEACML